MMLLMMAALFALGWGLRLPILARMALAAVPLLALVAAHLLLPEAQALRLGSQQELRSAALILLLGGLVPLYRKALIWLRARVPVEAENDPDQMSAAELSRYARHIMLREIGGPGQAALRKARVLVIGAGGLGAPALLYLAASGVGRITVIDDDDVDSSNLQRQIIHRDQDVGVNKAVSAKRAMLALNPFIEVEIHPIRLVAERAPELFSEHDIVLDGCDNFETRQLANATAVAAGIPLLSGAISQWEGQLSLFDPARGGPCYACLFPEAPKDGLAPSCAAAGVVGPLPGVIGTMMALEAVKLLTGAGRNMRGRMVIFDGLDGESRDMRVAVRPGCAVCGGQDHALASGASEG